MDQKQKINYFIIYDNVKFEILYKFESVNVYIISGILLDNNDLILNSNETIYIYRLKNNNYTLYKTILEKDIYKYLNYKLKLIKKINENTFMIISSYGFKIYNKDKNNNYICIFTYICDEISKNKILENVYKINKNEYILINIRKYESIEHKFIKTEADELVLEKLEIKNEDNNEDIKRDGSNEVNDGFYTMEINFFKELVFKNKYEKKELINYTKFECLSKYIILKNKYFLILIQDSLLILNLLNHRMKTYFITNGNIIKWNCPNDNKFLYIDLGNIILFELIDNNEIEDNIK